jgi:hypothetical protein
MTFLTRKRYLLPFLLLSFLPDITFSQVKLGIKGGINFATTRTKLEGFPGSGFASNDVHQYLLRPTTGLYVERDLNNVLLVQAEVSYLGTGYKNDYGITKELKVNNLYFPIGLRYRANKNLGVTAGPYISTTLYDEFEYYTTEGGERKKIDMGIYFGIDYVIKNVAGLGIRYNIGLRNVVEANYYEGVEEFNRGIVIYTFYQFELVKKKTREEND